MHRLALALLLVIACTSPTSENGQSGSQGVPGQIGPPGPAGPQGVPGPAGTSGASDGLVVVDADGTVTSISQLGYFTDASGLTWTVDFSTGAVHVTYANFQNYAGYESADCSGQMLMGYPMYPRWPFALGDGLGWRVRGDRDVASPATFRSRMQDGACASLPVPTPSYYPAFVVRPPSIQNTPTLPFRPPFHYEKR